MRENEKAINLEIDKKLWTRVGTYAVINETTRKEVVATALEKYLETIEFKN